VSDPEERQLLDTAYERFKRHLTDWIAIGVILSVALHYALFTLFPTLRAADISYGGRAITAVALPPVVKVPPPNLAPAPRPARAIPEEDRPRFIPYDTPPRLLNPEEIRALLKRDYPAALREARVEGVVVIWAYVDIEGEVGQAHVQQSSGFAAMDRAALDVALEMRFSPALNRDKKTPVWVQQSIVFQTK
jgi:TonB family protein